MKLDFNGVPEPLSPGNCHFCPEGHEHTLVNDGAEPLVFFSVVPTVGKP